MEVFELVQAAVASVVDPRFFETERGYQGQLAAQFSRLLADNPVWPGNPIVEEEYQKRAHVHGLRLRPDIIVHTPYGRPGVAKRVDGNYLVVALKLRAARTEAAEDFDKLECICATLHYPAAAFINVGSEELFLPTLNKETRIGYVLYEFAVVLRDGVPRICSHSLDA